MSNNRYIIADNWADALLEELWEKWGEDFCNGCEVPCGDTPDDCIYCPHFDDWDLIRKTTQEYARAMQRGMGA